MDSDMGEARLPSKLELQSQSGVSFIGTGDGDIQWTENLGRASETVQAAVDFGMDIRSLRVVNLATDVRAAVLHWQHEVGLEPSGTTELDPSEGTVGGKHLCWSDQNGHLHSIVVVQAHAFGPNDTENYGQWLLTHELAHVHDTAHKAEKYGWPAEFKPPAANDWPTIERVLGDMVWSEFFAEFCASVHSTPTMLTQDQEHWTHLLQGRLSAFDETITNYRRSGDHASIWTGAITVLGVLLAQLGRNLGQAVQGGTLEVLVEDTNQVSEPWADLVSNAAAALLSLLDTQFEEGTTNEAAWPPPDVVALAMQAFEAIGVEPIPQEDGVGFYVPARNAYENRVMGIQHPRNGKTG